MSMEPDPAMDCPMDEFPEAKPAQVQTLSYAPVQDDKYKKLGGWLILLAIGLFLAPFRFIGDFTQLINLFKTTTITEMKYFAVGWLAIDALLAVLYLMVTFSFFRRRRGAPRLFIWMISFNIISTIICDATLLMILRGYVTPAVLQEQLMAMLTSAIPVILVGLIWIQYFRVSERVRRTFVN